jgi:hypothetical protein
MDRITLYYNADNLGAIFTTTVNRGFDEVLNRLEALQRAGVRVVNTGALSEKERTTAHFEATSWPSAKKHYRIRPCFGRAGLSFGREVPALLVRGDDGLPEDVYPHENKEVPGTYGPLPRLLQAALRYGVAKDERRAHSKTPGCGKVAWQKVLMGFIDLHHEGVQARDDLALHNCRRRRPYRNLSGVAPFSCNACNFASLTPRDFGASG